jgi:hypothetical protein
VILSFDSINKRYEGKFSLQLTNNTSTIVDIKKIELQIDSNSFILIDSVSDLVGNYPTNILPETNKTPIRVALKSTIVPLPYDRQFTGSILFHVSRLGNDSIYKTQINVTILAHEQNMDVASHEIALFSITHNPVSDKLHVNFPTIVTGLLNYEIYDILGTTLVEGSVHTRSNQIGFTIPLPYLPNGSYILSCHHESKSASSKFNVFR